MDDDQVVAANIDRDVGPSKKPIPRAMSAAKGVYGTGSDVVRRTWKKPEGKKDAIEEDGDHDDEEEQKRLAKKKKKRGEEEEEEATIKRQGRGETLDLESNIGKTQVVHASGDTAKQPGFYCKACDVVLRDSAAYLDHINGRKHLRNVGTTMEVERSSVEQVRARIEMLKRKQEEGKKEYDFEARIAEIREKEAQEKQRQKEKKKRKRNKDKGGKDLSGEEDDEERDAGPMAGNDDDDMARIMGFGGFVAKK